ncbi:MAG: AAA family ATPase [Candidatus Tectomicrobia bacterium]|uniref:AAA family ATPase n=1 Tax=Tectimicrobiota bacterium TaxID=2528274 RepID=A0A933GPC9_UNCTE|nr:AAA family ATPase [Candidatus Tectomicrobia bacterium]
MEPDNEKDLELVAEIASAKNLIQDEMAKAIVGQKKVIEGLLIALFAKGHCLLEGVPGLAKTLMINTLADILDLKFNRIQFTPDLMPADITGTEVLEEDLTSGRRFFRFIKGPIFANIVLADEINRTPPKTQSALLQAMQEYHVTAGEKSYSLSLPFLVLATQNPIEQEGTYPLPEAQLDRFMFKLLVNYPDWHEEVDLVKQVTSPLSVQLKKVLNAEKILALQEMVLRVPVSSHVVNYAVKLVRNSRPTEPEAPRFIKDWVSWGAGPRASSYLILGGKSRAILEGRYAVSCEDIQVLAPRVLRHRIITNFQAEAEGMDTSQIIERLLKETPE